MKRMIDGGVDVILEERKSRVGEARRGCTFEREMAGRDLPHATPQRV
jgi:hypothetical protein